MTTDDTNDDFKVFSTDGIDDYFVKWCLGVLIFVLIALGAIYKHQFDRIIFIVVWSGLWATCIAGTFYALTTADVLIDGTRIARRVRGQISQCISWSNVCLIREYSTQVRQVTVTSVRIFPKKNAFWIFRLSGSTVISDRFDRFDELIAILNEHILRHPIKVEIKVNGRWEPRQTLPVSLQLRQQ